MTLLTGAAHWAPQRKSAGTSSSSDSACAAAQPQHGQHRREAEAALVPSQTLPRSAPCLLEVLQ